MSRQENKNISDFINRSVVILLCAGEGRRMKAITSNIPKPLLKVPSLNNKHIIEVNLENLKEIGFRNIFIVVGHLGSLINEYINSFNKKVQTIYSKKEYKKGPLNSLLEVLNSQDFQAKMNELHKEDFIFVMPGDTIFELELLNVIIDQINEFQIYLRKRPFIFYRLVKSNYSNNQNDKKKRLKNISCAIIQEQEPFPLLKKIIQTDLNNFNSKQNIHQIIPIIVFPIYFMKKILKREPSIRERTIKAFLNHVINKGEKIFALEIVSEQNFYDIDEIEDLKLIRYKKKKGQ